MKIVEKYYHWISERTRLQMVAFYISSIVVPSAIGIASYHFLEGVPSSLGVTSAILCLIVFLAGHLVYGLDSMIQNFPDHLEIRSNNRR